MCSVAFLILAASGWVHAQNQLGILSYNIHHGQDVNNKDRLKEMAAVITASGADIVGLQEVDSVCYRSGQVDQAQKLAELTGMHYVYVRHFAFEGGSYGQALLSKYPISTVVNHRLPIASDIPGETRAFLVADVTVSSTANWLIGVAHLDYRDADSRVNQAIQIKGIFKASQRPGILVGDMNANPDSKVIAVLREHFLDTQPDDFFTFPAIDPNKKIDYIFVDSPSIKIIKAEVIPVEYSDHRPVYTVIED